MSTPDLIDQNNEQSRSGKSARRRQDPVSCNLCRRKKLKCNRHDPCSNCVARNAACEYEQTGVVPHNRVQNDHETSNTAILSRLQRIEDLMLRMVPGSPQNSSPGHAETRNHGHHSVPIPNNEARSIESSLVVNLTEAEPSLFPDISRTFVFKTVPLNDILRCESESQELQSGVSRVTRILLPTYAEAVELMAYYGKHVRFYNNVLHFPTTQRTVDAFYAKLSRKEAVNTDHAALALTIFASVFCTYSRMGATQCSVTTHNPGVNQNFFLLFHRYSLDLIEHSYRVLSPSLEILQTGAIATMLDYTLEGLSKRARILASTSVAIARELGIHRLDTASEIRRRGNVLSIPSLIEVEVKRRIWWQLTASDWMLALSGSLVEGSYLINSAHMKVKLPRNIDDSVLERGNATEDLPLSHPTPMSYPIQRTRLAEIARTMIDTLHMGIVDPTDYDHNQVMLSDQRLQHFLEDLPIFFKLDPHSLRQSELLLADFPYFSMQRYVINISVHSIRCKLHQPYLTCGIDNPRFKESADICIASACKVMEINKAVRADESAAIPGNVKAIGLLHHMFTAIVVLVVSLCINKAENAQHGIDELVIEAIETLEGIRDKSPASARFLGVLVESLKKNNITIDSLRELRTLDPRPPPLGYAQPTTYGYPTTLPPNPMQDPTVTGSWTWQSFPDRGDFAPMPNWEQLFSELDGFIA